MAERGAGDDRERAGTWDDDVSEAEHGELLADLRGGGEGVSEESGRGSGRDDEGTVGQRVR